MRIQNARIVPVDAPVIESGYIDIENGIITAVGAMPTVPAEDIYDAQGATVFPGFIDAHCHLGMWEDGLDFEGDDGNEDTDPATPQLRAIDAVNPLDRCFAEARKAGITTVVTGPGSANPIGGQLCALKAYGVCVDEMIVKAPIAMKMALGENPKVTYHGKSQAPVTRMATAAIIREQLRLAADYDKQLKKAASDEDADEPEFDAKCEALLPVIHGELPVHFHAHRLDDIMTARRIAKEFSLQYVIVHGTEAHLAAEILAADAIDVLSGPILCDRSKPELRELTTASPALLHQAGVRLALITDHPETPLQYLGICAGLAVREGLPYEAALRAVTLDAASIIGIADRVGSITVGKDADLVLFDNDPFTIAAKPKAVMIDGKWVG